MKLIALVCDMHKYVRKIIIFIFHFSLLIDPEYGERLKLEQLYLWFRLPAACRMPHKANNYHLSNEILSTHLSHTTNCKTNADAISLCAKVFVSRQYLGTRSSVKTQKLYSWDECFCSVFREHLHVTNNFNRVHSAHSPVSSTFNLIWSFVERWTTSKT